MSKMAGNLGMKRYWAFISYSHADTKVAGWLHKALEGFKIPTPLIGTESRNGVVPKRIFPVFRDRDELPTSSDLGANLHAALRNSRYLVVLCSPTSATSMWVNAEVEFFKKTHCNTNVLCLIVDGVPGGSGDGEKAECFCPALKHHFNPDGSAGAPAEPIAADLRDSKDGRLRAFLKIVAGILGVDFDALYQREKRRKRRRMLVVSAVAGLLTLVGLIFYQRLDSVAKSQTEIASEVKKMREMKFRAFGELPEERAQALSAIIEQSGVPQAEETMATALEFERKRFGKFGKQINRYAKARSGLLSEFEDFIELVKPSIGWTAAAKTLSRFSYFFALEEVQGRERSIEMMNQQFQVARQMDRVNTDLDAQLADLGSALDQATAGVEQVFANTRAALEAAGGESEENKVQDTVEEQRQATSNDAPIADDQPYSEEFSISAPFGNKIGEASRLTAEMQALDSLLPADWVVGDTEPKPDGYYLSNRAKALSHAAWLLATAPDASVRDPRRALELSAEAAELESSHTAHTLDALAAASASAGDFDSALKWQTLAVRKSADASPQERDELLERYKLYESGRSYIRDGGDESAEDIVVCIANSGGFDSWLLESRQKLETLTRSLEKFVRTPEENVVVKAELDRLREQQSQMELDGELELNKLRREFANSYKQAQMPPEFDGYTPITDMDGTVTVSEKIWRKPSSAAERGSLKTITVHPAWPGTKPKIDREGSVELYCIQRFLFPSPDGSSLDSDKMAVAREFAQAAAEFLGVHLP
jgi:hypothetical protein